MLKQVAALLLLTIGCLAAISTLSGCGSKPKTAVQVKPPIATQAEADQLQLGMTYDQVAGIIGNPGKELPSNTSSSTMAVKHYVWANDDGSSLVADFADNKLVNKLYTPATIK